MRHHAPKFIAFGIIGVGLAALAGAFAAEYQMIPNAMNFGA